MFRLFATLALGAALITVPFEVWSQEVNGAPPAGAGKETITLSLEEAVQLAVRSAPRVLSRQARTPELEGLRVEAEIYPRLNPTFEIAVGPRVAGSELSPTVSLEFIQVLGLGGGVAARLEALEASLERSKAETLGTIQSVQRAVALAFVRVLWAEERLKLANEQAALALATLTATEQRKTAGDTSQLELNIAKMGIDRADADKKDSEALRRAALGQLRLLLGISYDANLTLKGKLSEVGTADLANMLSKAKNRPELAAIAAELREAEAEVAFGDTLAAPDLGLGVRYQHEDKGVNTIMGVFSLSLPFFDYGQGVTARSEAKKRRVQVDLQQRSAEVPIEIQSAYEVFVTRRAAALNFGESINFDENLQLASTGYKAGETSLSELLILRRELLDAKRTQTDRMLSAREAEIELRAAAGALQ